MKRIKLGSVCDILNGYAFKSKNYKISGIRIIRIANVQKGYIEDSDPAYYPEDSDEIEKYMLREGDLLISLTGNVGRVGLLNKEFLPAALNQRVACLRMKRDDVLLEYVFNYLNSNLFEQRCIMSANGIAQKNMSTEWLKEYEIPYVSLKQQTQIVQLLNETRRIADCKTQQLQHLDLLIKTRFVEMFGDPEHNKKGFIKTTMGEYIKLLTDFSANGSYKTLDSNVIMYDAPNYAWMVRTTDLESINTSQIKYIDKKAYNLLAKSKLYGGEIIMNKIGSAGKVYLMPKLSMPASLGRNAFMIRFDDRINVVYLFAQLTSEYGRNEIQQYVRGAVTKTITKDNVRSVKIVVPPIDLQNEFADFVAKVDRLKNAIQRSLDETQLLFDSLMQEYFG